MPHSVSDHLTVPLFLFPIPRKGRGVCPGLDTVRYIYASTSLYTPTSMLYSIHCSPSL